ncbi:MAG: gas vesicle protein GvpN, partial [Bacteroidota bacterium]
MDKPLNSVLSPQRKPDFVATHYIDDIAKRTLAYLHSGFPVHFRGAAGTGKTTMAKYIADIIGKPMVLIHGDEETNTSNLIGAESGFKTQQVVDNYISSVLKRETNVHREWVDSRLTLACKEGFTLIYDEFTRSRPEANNVLLSILEDRIVNLPVSNNQQRDPYVMVHPEFKAIFTSNPDEYSGVFKTQDALLDRMITIDLDYFDADTEEQITQVKTGLSSFESKWIVKMVRSFRKDFNIEAYSSIRSCIMLGKSIQALNLDLQAPNALLIKVCQDVLGREQMHLDQSISPPEFKKRLAQLIHSLYKIYRPIEPKAKKPEAIKPKEKEKNTPILIAEPTKDPLELHSEGL